MYELLPVSNPPPVFLYVFYSQYRRHDQGIYSAPGNVRNPYKKYPHWVLTWVDFGKHELEIFDSYPEEKSAFGQRCLFKRLPMPFCTSWTDPSIIGQEIGISRSTLRQKINDKLIRGHAGSLSVTLQAMKADLEDDERFRDAIDDKMNAMHLKMLELMLVLPIIYTTAPTVTDGVDDGDDWEMAGPSQTQGIIDPVDDLEIPGSPALAALKDNPSKDQVLEQEMPETSNMAEPSRPEKGKQKAFEKSTTKLKGFGSETRPVTCPSSREPR
ncbi:hypothetical protein C8J56DRAFT_896374 [Mycena floridula]|nr:hypothetical protein C8J56DRAFT_896374 [Mycena floridula]